MKKNINIFALIVFCLFLTSCEAYIEFEMMRMKWLIYFFFGSLIVGVIAMIFSDKN
jgi:hypothetical protein